MCIRDRETVEQDRTAAQETLAQRREQQRQARRALENARDEAEAAANIIAGHSLRMEERKKKAAAASEQRMQLTMDAGALENRIRLLREMEKDYEGFSKAVKLVCQAKGCLLYTSRCIYHESRGEDEIGQIAVCEIVLNRILSDVYPNTVEEVLLQYNGKFYQFSCAPYLMTNDIREPEALDKALHIVCLLYTSQTDN